MILSKQKKGKKHSKKKPFDIYIKIENLIVQNPALRSQDSGFEKQIEKQKGINKILGFLLVFVIFFKFGWLQMYVDNWDIIEPVSQLIEWIIIIVKLLMKVK